MDDVVDDPSSVADDHRLLRRIPPILFLNDANTGEYRPSSAAFDNDAEGGPMSTYHEPTVLGLGLPIEAPLIDHEGYGLASLEAGALRSLQQRVALQPDDSGHPCDPAHCAVAGSKNGKRRSKIRALATILVYPPH